MPQAPKQPKFWLLSLLLWFGVLWILSSSTHPGVPLPPIPYFDKIEHFGYFFGGAGLFSAFLFFRRPLDPPGRMIIPTVIVVIGIVGILDEIHQGFVPGRSGNDPFDWLADVTGATAGVFTFKAIHRRLQ